MQYNIITSDNFNISIDINIIKYSSFIYNLIENNINEIIHLKHYSCSYIKLNKIFEFLNFHYFCQNKNDIESWNYNFFNNIDNSLLFELFVTANYLDIQLLLNNISLHFANIINKLQTPLQLTNYFNIKNNITIQEQNELLNIYNISFL